MSTPKPLKDLYTVSDDFMLQHSKTMRLNFIQDQPSFITRDPDFNTPYELNWLAAITAAESHPTDEMVDDMLTEKTAQVQMAMTNCRNKWMDTKPFVKKAFPDNVEMWNKFGFDNYQNIDHSQEGMHRFFRLLHGTATQYAAELIAKNYTQVMIDEIETLRAALENANNEQEKFKTDIPVFTRQRTEKNNAVYAFSQNTGETGKLIFRNDSSKYQKYLLPASDETTPMILKGKVTQPGVGPVGTPALPVEGVNISVMGLPALTTQSDSNGNYGFGSIPAGTYTFNFNKAGYMPQSIPGVVITDISNPVTLNVVMTPMP